MLEGVIKGRQSSTITKATQIGLDLPDALRGKAGRLEACFGEMPDCADAIILGFPELARFGYQVEEDDDGHVWVHFHKLGVTMLAETPDSEPTRSCLARPVEPRVLDGPCVEPVAIYYSGEVGGPPGWICDDAWPGVKVIEGPLLPGAGKVIVAVEHGARAIISGTFVPWKMSTLTPAAAARAAMAAQLTQELSRSQARVSDNELGMC